MSITTILEISASGVVIFVAVFRGFLDYKIHREKNCKHELNYNFDFLKKSVFGDFYIQNYSSLEHNPKFSSYCEENNSLKKNVICLLEDYFEDFKFESNLNKYNLIHEFRTLNLISKREELKILKQKEEKTTKEIIFKLLKLENIDKIKKSSRKIDKTFKRMKKLNVFLNY